MNSELLSSLAESGIRLVIEAGENGEPDKFIRWEIVESETEALTAAVAPLKPPREWFEMPEPDGPTPMTYTDDGRAFGHLAPWGVCHAGLSAGALSECVQAPRSQTDYGRFHLGMLETAEGEMLPVGKIVLATGHAPMTANLAAATKHYDDTGSVGAFVRARDGNHGIWASGAVRSDLSPEHLRDLRANPVSGDWRAWNGALELVAALAVPVPGFPIPRSQVALAASGEISALILTEAEEEETMERSRSYIRQRNVIAASIAEDALIARTFTAEERRRMAESGQAMPDGSFPIANCEDFMNARQAIGRTPPSRRAAVRAHIRKRGRALGCEMEGME